ncbi:hypothetical protein CBR_g17796 [Chara braunii]|uniref:Uncharacterized protein n=1 Tax=Chara braunii TaxID=69332 RepID=A0A388KVJ5_CHABU|nr:hypothetical protein CBR_g17796 [Chara braunii]|eukprot:GBG74085.1 hypothetical protein CBR_g17796 [Chara braunii]
MEKEIRLLRLGAEIQVPEPPGCPEASLFDVGIKIAEKSVDPWDIADGIIPEEHVAIREEEAQMARKGAMRRGGYSVEGTGAAKGTRIELTWTRDSEHRAMNEDVELLIIQAWRTEVEGDLLGFVFGTVAPGHRQTIVGELLIPFTQLLDDLPIDIISHCDENPAPHILSWSLTPYLQWSACLEDQWGNGSYLSDAEYLNPRGITDVLFFQHGTKSGEEAEEEEEEAKEEEEEETSEEEENYSEYSEHESGAVSEESEEGEEEEQDGASAEEGADQAEAQEDDPAAEQRRAEIAEGKRPLEQSVGLDLPIPDDPTSPEPPKEEDELPHAEALGTPARRQRSRSPSPSPRPLVRARPDPGHRASSPVIIRPSP